MTKIDARNRLILALDVSSKQEADSLIRELDGVVNIFKVNLKLVFGGVNLFKFIDYWTKKGKQFFVDFKHDDTNDTVSEYIRMLSEKEVKFCTIYGNLHTINAALKGRNDNSDLKLLFVTVLTSLNDKDLKNVNTNNNVTVKDLTLLRAKMAIENGIDGVIASGREAKAIKRIAKELRKKITIVTPGVRLEKNRKDDHKRAATPELSIKNGSDYLVVGRPIYLADNPRKTAKEFIKRMQTAFNG